MATHRRGPRLTVDALILLPDDRIVLVYRKNEPIGWALPGGFVEEGETLEQAVVREAAEETGLALTKLEQFRAYSDPNRDPRFHTVSMVFCATANGDPIGGDDAAQARAFPLSALPETIVFDHRDILADFIASRG